MITINLLSLINSGFRKYGAHLIWTLSNFPSFSSSYFSFTPYSSFSIPILQWLFFFLLLLNFSNLSSFLSSFRFLPFSMHLVVFLFSRDDATLAATSFYLREEKDDNKVILEDKDLEVIGVPLIKYGDSTVILQHVETGLWLSYKVGVGNGGLG